MTARSTRSRRGNQIIEFVLVTPLFLALVFGVVEYGWFFSSQLSVTHASREGARAAAVAPRSADRAAIAEAAVLDRLEGEGLSVAPSNVSARVQGAYPHEAIVVDVQVPYSRITFYVPIPDTLGAHTVMRLEDQVAPTP